jgi:hypothetical protein
LEAFKGFEAFQTYREFQGFQSVEVFEAFESTQKHFQRLRSVIVWEKNEKSNTSNCLLHLRNLKVLQ